MFCCALDTQFGHTGLNLGGRVKSLCVEVANGGSRPNGVPEGSAASVGRYKTMADQSLARVTDPHFSGIPVSLK